jgi:hypothetical protein
MQRVEAWRAETNVQREGMGSPERRGASVPPPLTRLGFLSLDGIRKGTQVKNLCYEKPEPASINRARQAVRAALLRCGPSL